MNLSEQKQPALLAWEKLYKKEFKNAIICAALATVIFMTMLVLKIIYKDSSITINGIWLLSLAFFTACIAGLVYLLMERKKFLSSKEIETYTNEILHNTISQTSIYIITNRFIIIRLNITKPIDLSKVCWIYRKRTRVSNTSVDQIIMHLQNGKKRSVNYGLAFTESDVYHMVKPYNPDVLIGWSEKNKELYKSMIH